MFVIKERRNKNVSCIQLEQEDSWEITEHWTTSREMTQVILRTQVNVVICTCTIHQEWKRYDQFWLPYRGKNSYSFVKNMQELCFVILIVSNFTSNTTNVQFKNMLDFMGFLFTNQTFKILKIIYQNIT